MTSLKRTLAVKFKGAKRIVFLGVGSDLRGDDSAGIVFVKRLRKILTNPYKKIRLSFLIGSTAPENLTGKIKRLNPTHLVIVDAAMVGRRAGAIRLLSADSAGSAMFSTHTLPLNVMTGYLKRYIDCSIIIAGIRPGNTAFGKSLSPDVDAAIARLAHIISEALASSS